MLTLCRLPGSILLVAMFSVKFALLKSASLRMGVVEEYLIVKVLLFRVPAAPSSPGAVHARVTVIDEAPSPVETMESTRRSVTAAGATAARTGTEKAVKRAAERRKRGKRPERRTP